MPNPSTYFAGFFGGLAAKPCLVSTGPPTFSGISSLVANANGSLTASWSAGSSTFTPLTYQVFIQAGSATGLFTGANLLTEVSGLTTTLYTDAAFSPLAATTYYVGVRALDSSRVSETNTTSLSAVSAGIASNSLYNAIVAVPGQVWDVSTASHTSAGTFGAWIQQQLLTVGKFLGLK